MDINKYHKQAMTRLLVAKGTGDFQAQAKIMKEYCDFGVAQYRQQKHNIEILEMVQQVYELVDRDPEQEQDFQAIKETHAKLKEDNKGLIEKVMLLDQKYDKVMKLITLI